MLSGLHPIVDLNTMELLELEDVDPGPPPKVMGEYIPRLVPGLKLRDDVKTLEITQPEGPSFTLDGHELRWQKWSMRLGFNYREGLVIHTVAYEDAGRCRQIAHRAASERFYGTVLVDPRRRPRPCQFPTPTTSPCSGSTTPRRAPVTRAGAPARSITPPTTRRTCSIPTATTSRSSTTTGTSRCRRLGA